VHPEVAAGGGGGTSVALVAVCAAGEGAGRARAKGCGPAGQAARRCRPAGGCPPLGSWKAPAGGRQARNTIHAHAHLTVAQPRPLKAHGAVHVQEEDMHTSGCVGRQGKVL